MAKEKTGWGDIPSLPGLEVDWKFEPENPLGKRAWQRIVNKDLYAILGVKNIPIKVVAKNFEEIGSLLDLAQGGFSVLLKTKLAEGQLLKVGFLLGNQKVISRAKIINVRSLEGRYRVGVEFVELDKDLHNYIGGVISSRVFQQPL
ncbi:MAG: PilZ domain-containing protein [Pseudomonadota bacterium]